MDIKDILIAAQKCISNNPVIVLGSGASLPHKIRGMEDLAKFLQKEIQFEKSTKEGKAWPVIYNALPQGYGLEKALQDNPSPDTLVRKIVDLTWKAITEDDLALLKKAAAGQESFPLSDLVKKLFNSTNTTIHIVTPNYDRVPEYATDLAGYVHATGFVPGIIRSQEDMDATNTRGQKSSSARIVRIWKVHGSLDWFEDKNGQVLCLPLTDTLPQGFSPLIVTPGSNKYEKAHDLPFRSVIQGADKALKDAGAFLCIGYGFRDPHIHPILVKRCRQKNVPIVILARTLTDEAKCFLKVDGGSDHLAMERCDGGTRVFTSEIPAGTVIKGHDLWSFREFNDEVF